MDIKKIPIEQINPAPYNPRKDLKPGDPEYEKIRNSIARFGYIDPVIWNKRSGNLVGGHQRFKVLLETGAKEIDCVVVDLDATDEKAANIALNKISGEWDFSKLKELLVELDTGDFDISLTGFDELELKELIDYEGLKGETDADAVPATPKKAVSKTGDLWVLGDHRLLCGDSTKPDNFKTLMAGKKADMVFTDPPYGIDYENKSRFLDSFGRASKQRNFVDITNDAIGKDKLFALLVKAFTLAREYGMDHCSYYVTAPQGGELGMMMMMMMMMMASKLPTRHVLIWNKNSQNFSLGRLDYEYKHEPILFTWKKTHKFYGQGEHKNSVWDISKERKCTEHPTMKPVALVANAVLNSSKKGDIVMDIFGGSGTTVIASEQYGRKCRMMELEPKYCDVIVERWEKFTGKKAKRQ